MQEKGADGSYSYTWLLAIMLNFKYLVSLTNFLELKNQLLIFVESEMIPALIFGEKSLIVTLCEYLAQQALHNDASISQSFQLTLEYFVAKMVDPGDDFAEDMKPVLRIDDFAELFNKVGKSTAKMLLDSNFACSEQPDSR